MQPGNDSLFPSPWHKESYQRFLTDSLPTLISQHQPLTQVRLEEAPPNACHLHLTFGVSGDALSLTLDNLPLPDDDGIFTIPDLRDTPGGARRVVVPIASSENLEVAEISCVGELLLRFVSRSLEETTPPADPQRFIDLLRETILEFFDRAQMVDPTNHLASITHRRRLFIQGEITGFHPSQVGRICVVETPEGPNLGRIGSIARGASIQNGKLLPARGDAAETLGVSASLIPFIAHSEPARLLMGANMMRQWQRIEAAEPPLVTTGVEPAVFDPEFSPGVNLLTGYISWGAASHEDALVISETTARRLAVQGRPVAIGDKLSNRHGSKGVVSIILPEQEMPHLPDGTPVDICYSFFGLPSRMNYGQLLEAALGWAAHTDGQPAVAPPFASSDPQVIAARLRAAGLPPHGMVRLTDGRGGNPLDRESTVGCVYWGRTAHDAADKVQVVADDSRTGQSLGLDEYRYFREAGATETLKALFADQVQGGGGKRFAALKAGLQSVGIEATRTEAGVRLAFSNDIPANALRLAVPVPHPFLSGHPLTFVAGDDASRQSEDFKAIRDANDRLVRMQQSGAPPQLLEGGVQALQDRVQQFAENRVSPAVFLPEVTVRFSGRAVISPGLDIAIEEIGLPDDLTWAQLRPHGVVYGTATTEMVQGRTEEGLRAVQERMARTLVLITRQPKEYTTPTVFFIALRPVYRPGNTLRFPLPLCNWLEADFDGDQLAVFLPVGEEAQKEIAQRFTVESHLRRHPSLLLEPYWGLAPGHGVLYGLAERSRTAAGRKEIAKIVGRDLPPGLLYRPQFNSLLQECRDQQGIPATLELVQRLCDYGFAAARQSGASFGPFPQVDSPPMPLSSDDDDKWERWAEEVVTRLNTMARNEGFEEDTLGPALLSAVSGARGRTLFLAKTLVSVAPGKQKGLNEQPLIMAHGWRDGLTPEEFYTVAMNTRRALHRLIMTGSMQEELPAKSSSVMVRLNTPGQGVLAQASRSPYPGISLAQAAQNGETDPLIDIDSQLL